MSSPSPNDLGHTRPDAFPPQPIVIQTAPPRRFGWLTRLLLIALVLSIVWNLVLYSSYEQYFAASAPPREMFHSGERLAGDKIALLEMRGTIMPPFTERLRKAIERAEEDDDVKGVVLVVDSPGGLVADSHQIYHDLVKLREKKPVYVAMQRLAASGGYYIAMGAGPQGKIFAEPTTWTGSIGVIIPRFDASKLAEQLGVESAPLKTGELKDALNPFREMSPKEREVWTVIMNDSFERFLHVIDENRDSLDAEKTRALATGQIYTAEQARQSGLVDEIGYDEDAIKALKSKLGLERARIVRYEFPVTMMELLTGTVKARQPETRWQAILDATVPRAMYYCSWAPLVPERIAP